MWRYFVHGSRPDTEIADTLYADAEKTESCRGSYRTTGKKIIERDFTDPLFGPYRIAEELRISNSYFSTVFKHTYNMTLVHYITQLRIDEAKRLILTTDMDIKAVASASGFSSDISFIRVFKKYEATTPCTFRKEDRIGTATV